MRIPVLCASILRFAPPSIMKVVFEAVNRLKERVYAGFQ